MVFCRGLDNFPKKTMKTSTPHYFHCATKGFDHSILFADVREFVAGMNRIGICQAQESSSYLSLT